MNVGWLIDGDMFLRYRDELVAAIRDQGHDVKLIYGPKPPFRWDDVGCSYREAFPQDACVVSHGDIELVTRIRREGRWVPGAFCSVENFFWSSYACWYGKYLLNRDYIMLPFGELNRCKDLIFDRFGRDDRVFVRPDSPLKIFTGQVASRPTFAADLEFMGFYDVLPNAMVVVSSPKGIVNEWRFVVASRKVVAGCQYKHRDALDVRPEFDSNAFDLAKSIAAIDYEPDPVWVLDICKAVDNSYDLLEIGGFSFADLYACNKADVVAAVSAVAKDLWEKTSA